MLHFKQPAGTSRGVYTERKIWLVRMSDGEHVGIGECAPLPKLSCDDIPDYSKKLKAKSEEFVAAYQQGAAAVLAFFETMRDYPSMLFGLETAMLSFTKTQPSTPFSRGEVGIPINGLVWMGTYEEMQERIEQKLAQGFHCVKLKIGAIDFDAELDGQAGIQQLAGDATMLYYFLDEAQEGGKAFLEKRKPDFEQYPKIP